MTSKGFHAGLLKCLLVFFVAFQMVMGGVTSALSGEKTAASAALAGSKDRMAPDFELEDLDGNPVKLSRYREEKGVLIYFWATWCPHCITAQPRLAKLRREIGEKDLELLGINVGSGDSLDRVKRFQKGHPVSWPILYDTDSKVSRLYGVQGIPLFVIVDRQGREVFRGNSFPEDPMKYLGH